MLTFAGWSTYGTIAIVGRTQGIAILLNRFYSTAINSAYGIGTQIVGQLSFISTSIATAINPQMTKAVGAGDIKKAVNLAESSAKFSIIFISMLLIPVYYYIDFLLNIWLNEVPEYTALICKYIIIITIVELLTQSLNFLNWSIGNIKIFSTISYTTTLIAVPLAYIFLKWNLGVNGAMLAYLIVAIAINIFRIVYLYYKRTISIITYIKNVISPVVIILSINAITCHYMSIFFTNWGIICTGTVSIITTFITTYAIGLQPMEKEIITSLIKKVLLRK